MERLTAEALARLPKERKSVTEAWSRQLEGYEEFAVRGLSNIIQRRLLESFSNVCGHLFEEEEGEGRRIVEVPVGIGGRLRVGRGKCEGRETDDTKTEYFI